VATKHLVFFVDWIAEFARHQKHVTVVCLYKGPYQLPENVTVLSLGKEAGVSRITYLWKLFSYIMSQRKNYSSVFIHMNQIYAILGFLPWALMRKKVGMWYAHGKVSLSLRIATACVDHIFTSTKEGFKIPSKKVHILGQGIQTAHTHARTNFIPHKLITVGRVTKTKNIALLLEAFVDVMQQEKSAQLYIIGGPATPEDTIYERELHAFVTKHNLQNNVFFLGPQKHAAILSLISDAHLFVNLSNTGSLDKAILEAWSINVPVASCNSAFLSLAPSEIYKITDTAPHAIAEKIRAVCAMQHHTDFRSIVVAEHSLTSLISKILALYSTS
jgi:glycosyltransferase involved in cell wall biosynthesis